MKFKLCSLISLRTASLTVLIISLIVLLSQFLEASTASTLQIAALVVYSLSFSSIVGCIYSFYNSSIGQFRVGAASYLSLSIAIYVIWALRLSYEYANKSGIIDKCVQDANSNGKYQNVSDAEIRQICEDALPTYLHTRTFTIAVIGALIIYFNTILISFYMELVSDPDKYSSASHWFPMNTASTFGSSNDQYQLDDLNEPVHEEPTPEYTPPLPPYREKQEQAPEDTPGNSHSSEGNSDNQSQQRNIFRIE